MVLFVLWTFSKLGYGFSSFIENTRVYNQTGSLHKLFGL